MYHTLLSYKMYVIILLLLCLFLSALFRYIFYSSFNKLEQLF